MVENRAKCTGWPLVNSRPEFLGGALKLFGKQKGISGEIPLIDQNRRSVTDRIH